MMFDLSSLLDSGLSTEIPKGFYTVNELAVMWDVRPRTVRDIIYAKAQEGKVKSVDCYVISPVTGKRYRSRAYKIDWGQVKDEQENENSK